jgi:DNA polymerase-3 subunit epsilon
MRDLNKEIFVCVDCEMTGLDSNVDKVIEVAVIKFTLDEILEQYESLIDPGMTIPESSIKIHHITDDMVVGKPKLEEVAPQIIKIMGSYPVVGHGIKYDVELIAKGAESGGFQNKIRSNPMIDTLRLARLYGESPINSLEMLRKHFNVPEEGAHRAMSDVIVNREVFRHLSKKFSSLKEILGALSKPILMKTMPLGKHKGRLIKEIPIEYLIWASHKDFDEDLIFSLRHEIKRRKKGGLFTQASNPFSNLD